MASACGGIAVDGGVAAALGGLVFEGPLVDLDDQFGRIGTVGVNQIDEQFSGDGTGRFGNLQAEQDRHRVRPRTGPRISRPGMDEAEIPFRVGYAHDEAHIVGECLRVSAVLRRSQGELCGVVVGLADLPDGRRGIRIFRKRNDDYPHDNQSDRPTPTIPELFLHRQTPMSLRRIVFRSWIGDRC